jgi:hypothetical protein
MKRHRLLQKPVVDKPEDEIKVDTSVPKLTVKVPKEPKHQYPEDHLETSHLLQLIEQKK